MASISRLVDIGERKPRRVPVSGRLPRDARVVGYEVRWRPAPNQREQTKRLRTFEDARAFAANVDAKRSTGIEVDLRGGRRLFAEYAESWLTRRTLAVRTSELYRQLLDTHLLPTFGDTPLQHISAEQVERWVVESRTKAPVANAKAYRLLRSILATAVDDTVLGRNPCRIKGAGREDTPERPYVEPTVVLALAEAAHQRLRTMILLAAFGAGYRISELRALRQRDFDRCHGTISVTRTIDKLGRVKGPKSAAGGSDRSPAAVPPGCSR